jgi:hypothetical protein
LLARGNRTLLFLWCCSLTVISGRFLNRILSFLLINLKVEWIISLI